MGHYTVARLCKVSVTDFSIGFGKVLYSFKDKNNTNWKFSIIPLGGYVKIKGLDSIFKKNNNINNEKDSFFSLSLIQKIYILLAGSFFNILSAWLCLFCIFFFFGITNILPIIGNIVENSPAYKNDLRKGDIITEINNKHIQYFNDIPNAINNNQKIEIEIIRKNDVIKKEFDLFYNNQLNKYIIGISSTSEIIIDKYNFVLSIKKSISFIPIYYYETIKYLQKSYNNNTLSNEVAGPIGMVKMADKLMLDKLNGVLIIFISISLFVGLFNLFPIPLLDGGHIIYFIIRSIFSNNLSTSFTKFYLITGFIIISFLFFIITFNDIFYK